MINSRLCKTLSVAAYTRHKFVDKYENNADEITRDPINTVDIIIVNLCNKTTIMKSCFF